MKKRTLFITIFLFTFLVSKGQVSKHATARVMESQVKELSRIVVVYETGESETIPLKIWKSFGNSAATNKVFIENQKTLNKFINDMAKKGYELSQITNTGESFFCSFMVFVKKE